METRLNIYPVNNMKKLLIFTKCNRNYTPIDLGGQGGYL